MTGVNICTAGREEQPVRTVHVQSQALDTLRHSHGVRRDAEVDAHPTAQVTHPGGGGGGGAF